MNNVDHFLTDKDKRRGFLGLYFGRITMAISGGLLGVFLPIFLYTIFDENIMLVALYYGVSALLYLFLVAFGAQFLNRFGFRKALVIANLTAAALYSTYYFTTKENAFVLLSLSLIFLVVFRMLFWIPYHTDFAIFTDVKKRGGQVGLLLSTLTLLGVVGPIIAGRIIEVYSMQSLFLISIIIFIIGSIPFAMVPRTNEKFSWSYQQSWRELFAKKNKAVVWSSIAMGAESTIGVVVWPIFIFIILNGDYFKVGALSSLIVGITVLFQYMFGHYLDKIEQKHTMLKAGSILYSIGWLIKIFVITAFDVFVAGLYHKVVGILSDTSYKAIFYDLAAGQGHYVDEFTTLEEMSVQIGRIITLTFVVILITITSLKWTFILGAIASLAFTALSINAKEKAVV